MINKVKVEIAGNSYSIVTVESGEYLYSLSKDIDKHLSEIMKANPRLSLTDALVLCIINYYDTYKKSEIAADSMKIQLTNYLEDAARARIDLDEAKREIESLRRQLNALKQP